MSAEPRDLWVWGYGSLVWRVSQEVLCDVLGGMNVGCAQPGFEFEESHGAYLEGFRRRFWQASPEHRGTRYGFGRVVTIIRPDSDIEDDADTVSKAHQEGFDPAELYRVHGMVYRVRAEIAKDVSAALAYRERAGYGASKVHVMCDDGVEREADVFWGAEDNTYFRGPEPAHTIGAVIATSAGESGPNLEYFCHLLAAMRARGVSDPHMEAIAEAVEAHSERAAKAMHRFLSRFHADSDAVHLDEGVAGRFGGILNENALVLASMAPRSYPLGSAVPRGEQHSVVVALPTLFHCEGYETGDPAVTTLIRHGYPRFVVHATVLEVHSRVALAVGVAPEDVVCVANRAAALELAVFVWAGAATTEVVPAWSDDGETLKLRIEHPREVQCCVARPGSDVFPAGVNWWFVVLPETSPDARQRAKAFCQHTGVRISSREAETSLSGSVVEGFDSIAAVAECVADAAQVGSTADVCVGRSGMNAFYSVFKAINRVSGRSQWMQIGFLYVDTRLILERFSTHERLAKGDYAGLDSAQAPPSVAEPRCFVFLDASDKAAIEGAFERFGHEIAGVVTEVPSNPTVKTLDLAWLRGLCDKYGCALVVDPTVSSVFAVDVFREEHAADVAVMSMTKYFAPDASVMAGAAIRNPRSSFLRRHEEVWPLVSEGISPLFPADASRLAEQCAGARAVVEQASRSCESLARYLESRTDCVERVHWALQEDCAAAYRRVARDPEAPLVGSIVSVVLKGGREGAAAAYDSMSFVKGPSFGIAATLVCPYAVLAHYDQVATAAGQAELRGCGVDPWILRISVGLEDTASILAAVERALPARDS
jgi:cystathionine beta-lyase/cystathionine gamma-synthase/cation transport regulator ChaC